MYQSTLLATNYLPSIEYFCVLSQFENILIEVNEYFLKQTSRNRCFINTAQGMKMLTVPLADRHTKAFTKDIQIEPGNKWRNNHWRTIESAYRKAPYFDFYSDELKRVLYQDHLLLIDLNTSLLSFCLKQIGFEKKISVTLAYQKQPDGNTFDLRSAISAKNPLNESEFYKPFRYYQVFGSDFVPNLSVIDLLFCEGPRAGEIIRASKHYPNK